MTLSVIIPTYNRVNLIRFTLDSVLPENQKGVDFEVIVVDDASTDGTWEFIGNNYPHVKLFKNERKGAPAARNTGLEQARGKYILYLDSDDIIGANYFHKKVELLESNSMFDACYGEYEFFEATGEFRKEAIVFKHKYPMYTDEHHSTDHIANALSGNYIPPIAIIWRKRLLIRCKGHAEALLINQDVDLFFRAIFSGGKIVALKDGTYVYVRQHSLDERVGNASNTIEKWRQILELRKEIYQSLKKYEYHNEICLQHLSRFLFSKWQILRHVDRDLANEYLQFAKEVYWPINVNGRGVKKMLSKLIGPVNFVKLKYAILRHD